MTVLHWVRAFSTRRMERQRKKLRLLRVGRYRECGIIPHTKDMDLSYLSTEWKQDVLEALKKRQLPIALQDNGNGQAVLVFVQRFTFHYDAPCIVSARRFIRNNSGRQRRVNRSFRRVHRPE